MSDWFGSEKIRITLILKPCIKGNPFEEELGNLQISTDPGKNVFSYGVWPFLEIGKWPYIRQRGFQSQI